MKIVLIIIILIAVLLIVQYLRAKAYLAGYYKGLTSGTDEAIKMFLAELDDKPELMKACKNAIDKEYREHDEKFRKMTNELINDILKRGKDE